MMEWQPIETAPKDGTVIILYAAPEVICGWWQHTDTAYPWRFIEDGGMAPYGCCDMESEDRIETNGYTKHAPTHWTPLPPPPKDTP